MEFLTSLLGRSGYLPHGYCFTWTPGLLWSMVSADAVIAASYFSIPVALTSFVRKRGDSSMNGLLWLFSAFIFACGTTHVMDIWTIWQPDYALQALSKLVTAAISLVTAVAIWPLIPKALKIPSVSQLQAAISTLEAEVSKRKSAEEHLVDLQQSLAVTLASIGAGFVATDREGRVTRMNAVAEQVLGWSQDEARGEALWTVFDRDGRPSAYLAMNAVDVVIEQRWSVDTAHQIVAVSRDKTRTPLDVRAALTHAADGSVRGLAIVFRDTSPLIRAEAESMRLAAIVESSSDAIIGKSLDGYITSWNGAAQAMFGYAADEVVGRRVAALIPSDYVAEELCVLADLGRGMAVPTFDSVRRTKDGRLLRVSMTVSPVRDAQGRITGASKILRDVSQLRRDEAALRSSEARLRFTLDSAQIGDWDLDLVSGIANRSLRHDRCFGYDEVRADWSFDMFAEHLHPDDRDEVVHKFHRAIAESTDWRVECRVIWPDASVHWISCHGSIEFDAAGKPLRMLGIVTDTTRQKLAEEARLKAQRLEAENLQIQESSRLKSQFLANMSHELRTPLNAVIGFADLLRSGAVPPASPKHMQFLGHIATSGRHLLQLINDVLDLSKVESGKFEFFPEPVDLPLLVKDVIDVLHTAIQAKSIRITADVDPALTDLVLDPGRLKQVLYNYLSNAIKFTANGGSVAVRARTQDPHHFRIEVEDTGIGISEADLPRLFSDFQQLDAGSTKQHQGTGLGLALTRRLVQAQGGSVGVRSVPGRGSVFHLVLNLVHGADAPQAGDTVPAQLGGPQEQRYAALASDRDDQARVAVALAETGFQLDGISTPERSTTAVVEAPAAAGFPLANVLSKPIHAEDIVSALSRFRLPEPRRATVMVIDDDPVGLSLMQAAVKGIGIDAVCFLSGHEALRDIEQHRPDAIILDLIMPNFDGFAVLNALRQLPAWRDTPVFIWTSKSLSEEDCASLERTARAIVNKRGDELVAMLDALRRWRPPVVPLADGSQP